MAGQLHKPALGLLRNGSVLVFVALLLWLARPTRASLATGFALVVLGESIRCWAAGHLRKTVELITAGPYRHTRNPLYLGRLLIFTGLTVMAALPYGSGWLVLALGYAVFFGYYLRRKERVEPARLRQVHGGAYERYHRSVPALVPALRPYAAASRHRWSFRRLLDNREHWMVVGLLVVSAVLLWLRLVRR